MPFPASVVGAELDTVERAITPRAILAYAAGLGACEPAFLDDARANTLAALPFQCVSLEWPALLSLRTSLAGLPPHESVRGVHAVQDSQFHRPIRAGDKLVTSGRVVSARRIPAGVLSVIKLDTQCQLTGEPVVTSWSSSIYRDVELEGPDTVIAEAPNLPADAATGRFDTAEVTEIPISRQAPHVYSECADIWNPIHTERTVALSAGLPDIILHGTATWALAGLTILRRYADCDVSRIKRLSGRFSGMVIPGESISVRHVREGQVVRFEVATQNGGAAMSHGVALLAEGIQPASLP